MLSEMQNHEDYDDDWTFINSQNEELKSLMEEYNTDYFAYTVVIKYWQPSNIYGNLIYMGLLVPQFYPIIVDMYRKKKQSAFITYVYNASRGDVAVSYEYNSRNNLDNNMLRAYIYEMFTNLQK